nr:transposase [Actinopolyspora erythraea]
MAAPWVVSDELWERVEPLLPVRPAGRADRALLDRDTTGSTHHLICDGGGVPLAVTLIGGSRADITQLLPLVEAIPLVCGRRGRPRRTLKVVVADCGHDHDKYRDLLLQLGIQPLISHSGIRDANQPVRWGVEHTLALLHQFRRLATR